MRKSKKWYGKAAALCLAAMAVLVLVSCKDEKENGSNLLDIEEKDGICSVPWRRSIPARRI